ncbi:hypothetical protein [Streptomyces palmae]|uniref:DUF4232 domain-containing protein n=1 Tax=Streptomyces palmae TaxID=1701085 RepID=A0A4Z0G899_9ACTN|nr:hypothetical protein [Streptomyces palmae]TGA91393.1 hypothetical protein E4099_28240 [Streptomyces palmae]
MGSLRNPIGPLPSSIYWRRRAVAVLLVALLVALVVWALSMGGSGGGKKDEGKGTGSGGAANTITPGPSSTTPVHSGRPGGRDEADPQDSGGGTAGGGADGDSDGDGGPGGGGAGQGIGTGDRPVVSATSPLPDCKAGAVELTVRSVKDGKVKNDYEPGEKPTFELVVKNSSVTACKVDFGHESASLTITNGDNKHVWATTDCPKGSAVAYVEVPGKGETVRSLKWDRKRSAENCEDPAGSATAGPDTYLVEAKVGRLAAAQVSFVLKKD